MLEQQFRIQANLMILADRPPQNYLEILNSITTGFSIVPDIDCRFDEVPAFIATRADAEVVLFGVPDGEVSDYYILSLSSRLRKTLFGWRTDLEGTFLHAFLREKALTKSGFMDLSDEFVEMLIRNGLVAMIAE